MKQGVLAVAAVVLAACAADRPPPVATPIPAYCPSPPAIPVNAQGVLLPPRLLVNNAVDWQTDFAYQLQFIVASPQTLAGKPADTAQLLAHLVMLGNGFARDFRFQTLPAFGTLSMQQGVQALRAGLGIPTAMSDAEVALALLRTECALRAGDRAAARSALALVASAPDALGRIAPEDGAAPRIPTVTAAAASQAVRAMQLQEQRRRP